jgi:hypothetical protein
VARRRACWTRREEEEFWSPLASGSTIFSPALSPRSMARVAAATKIQALIRGHQLRSTVRFMDCAECLVHGVAPCEVEGRNICRRAATRSVGIGAPTVRCRFIAIRTSSGLLQL